MTVPATRNPAQLPSSVEAERAVIGAILIDPKFAWPRCQMLSPECFTEDSLRQIFRAVTLLVFDGSPIDIVAIGNSIDEIPGIAGLMADLMEAVPSAANVDHYVKLVAEQDNKRKLMYAFANGLTELKKNGVRAGDVARTVEKAIAQQRHTDGGSANMQAILKSKHNELLSRKPHVGISGMPTGYYKLDELTDGWRAGEMVVLAARPSQGKTALAGNIMRNVAATGRKVGVFSLEMQKGALVNRQIASEAHVNYRKVRGKVPLTSEEQERVGDAINKIYELPIRLYDSDDIGETLYLDPVMQFIRQQHAEHKFDLIIVDHLQSFAPDPKKHQKIDYSFATQISGEMKQMAKRLKVTSLLVSQLSRKTEDRQGGSFRPRIDDLRGTGALEQDADHVMLLYRPEAYKLWLKKHTVKVNGKDVSIDGIALLDVPKSRDSDIGMVALTWRGAFQRFENWTEDEQTEMPEEEPDEREVPF